MGFLPGNWKKCTGMNRNGKCVAPAGTHIRHKKSFGSWYGQVPDQPEKKVTKKKDDRQVKPGWFR